MPSDLTVSPVSAVGAAYENTQPAPSEAAALQAPPAPVSFVTNPSYQLDPALNLVVIQLHNKAGDVVSSIPSQRHLQAYLNGLASVPTSSPPIETLPPVTTAPATPVAPVTPSPAPAPAVITVHAAVPVSAPVPAAPLPAAPSAPVAAAPPTAAPAASGATARVA